MTCAFRNSSNERRPVNHLITALDLDYIPRDLYDDLRALADETRRLLNGYISYLKRRKQGENEPGSQIATRETQDAYELEDSEPNHAVQSPPEYREPYGPVALSTY
jgi:hypothetical protein